MPVEPILELEQRLPQFLDGVEGPYQQELLLQGPDEPLGHAVAFRCPDEAGAGFDSHEAELLLEGMSTGRRPASSSGWWPGATSGPR